MSATTLLGRGLVCCILSLGTLSCSAAGPVGPARPTNDKAGRPGGKEGKAAAKMVDAIVNRNKPPKLVGRPSGSWPGLVALYPESYDWKEEERVRQAIDKLYQDRTVELWEELARRKANPSYCVVVVSDQTEDAQIFTVGTICRGLAYSRLVEVFVQHMPPDPDKNGRPIITGVGIGNLADWRKERMQKPLYQLQIEVGEKMLRELSKVNVRGVRKHQIDSAREKIEAEIEKLSKTEQPVFLKDQSFPHNTYSKDVAKRVRDAVRRGSSEGIAIIK
jgi:hypothetical protein